MASCRFCLFATAFDGTLPAETAGFTAVDSGSFVTFTRLHDPTVEPR
jgi:hypothetical protein